MKKILFAMSLAAAFGSSVSFAEDFLVGDDLKKAFCGKTFMEGENFESGWTFKVFYPEKCNEIIVHYLTGDKAGQRFTRSLRIYPSGDHCVVSDRDGKDRCEKFVMVSEGVYHAIRGGKARYSRTKSVNGNQLDN
jgi:hypothetical protein